MAEATDIVTVDVRGEICPAPLFIALEAMRSISVGQEVELLTDFLPAVLTVTNAALKEGWNIHIRISGTKEWNLRLHPADASVT